MSEKFQEHYGIRFCRDDKSGYYLNSNLIIRAHRFVWEKHNGPIPDGMHIHHKDENKGNNDISNLEMMPAAEHLSMHQIKRVSDPEYKARMDQNLDNIRDLTKEWHGSEEGLDWHKQHGHNVWNAREATQFVCEQCDKEFENKTINQNKFCSNACKSAWRRNSGLDNVEKACPNCGTTFISNKYLKVVTCSRACANTYRKYRKDNGLF